jgi:phosphate transport system protein
MTMDAQRSHILSPFDEALNALRAEVLKMASLTEQNLTNAINGLFARRDDLCNQAIAEDESVDQLEIQVDKDGVAILTRFQPVATDLRQIVTAMKVGNNLERIADQAVNIARKARKLNRQPELPEMALLAPMFNQAMSQFKDSLQGYLTGDVALSTTLKTRDKILDGQNAEVSAKLTDTMTGNPKRIPDYLNLMFIARHLERVGDHATNIAEDAVYAAAAQDIRHQHGGAA